MKKKTIARKTLSLALAIFMLTMYVYNCFSANIDTVKADDTVTGVFAMSGNECAATVNTTDGATITVSAYWAYVPAGSILEVKTIADGGVYKAAHGQLNNALVYGIDIKDSNGQSISNAAATANVSIAKSGIVSEMTAASPTIYGSAVLNINTASTVNEGSAVIPNVPVDGMTNSVAVGTWSKSSETFLTTGGKYDYKYILSNYNVFLEGDMNGSHMVGPHIIGGTATLSLGGLSVGGQYPHTVSDYVGTKNGNKEIITDSNIAVYLGDGEYQTYISNTNAYNFTLTNTANYSTYNDYYFTENFVDFDAAKNAIEKQINGLSGDRLTTVSSAIDLEIGKSYELSADELSRISTINFTGDFDSTTDTYIIVRDQGEVSLPAITSNSNLLESIESGMTTNVIWVLPNATTVSNESSSQAFSGHIIAPNADVKLVGGNFNGCVIAKSLVASGTEGHMWPYLQKVEESTSDVTTTEETTTEEVTTEETTTEEVTTEETTTEEVTTEEITTEEVTTEEVTTEETTTEEATTEEATTEEITTQEVTTEQDTSQEITTEQTTTEEITTTEETSTSETSTEETSSFEATSEEYSTEETSTEETTTSIEETTEPEAPSYEENTTTDDSVYEDITTIVQNETVTTTVNDSNANDTPSTSPKTGYSTVMELMLALFVISTIVVGIAAYKLNREE